MAWVRVVVELVVAALMVVGIVGLLLNRVKFNKGIGVRSIQFACVTLIIPAIIILGLENVLRSETIGTLFGAIVGYVLSGIAIDESSTP